MQKQKDVEIIHDNLITVDGVGKVFDVSTIISFSTLADNYPIYDEKGELYSLEHEQMTISFSYLNNTIPFYIGGKVFMPKVIDSAFEVSENEETSFTEVVLEFRLHADDEEQARLKLHELVMKEGNYPLDFSVNDFKHKRTYDMDILCYQLSGSYKATEVV